jgi:hypothetical protein
MLRASLKTTAYLLHLEKARPARREIKVEAIKFWFLEMPFYDEDQSP